MIDDNNLTIRRLIRARTEEEVYHTAAAALDRSIDAEQSTIIPVEDCTRDTQIWTETASLDIPGQRPLISGIIGQAFSTGETWVVDDLLDTRSASTQTVPADPTKFRSLLCIPVDEWCVFVAVAYEMEAFSDDDLKVLKKLREYVVAALSRISQSEAEQQRESTIQEVANIIGHDVRNLLTVANGQVTLVNEECNSEYLAELSTTHERLEELIDDVVRLARSGEHIGATEVTDLQEVVKRAWTTIETADAELVIDDSAMILADESLLSLLFENLFRNAITHVGSSVEVRVGVLEDPPGFYVADNGSGIPSEYRETVFERGYSTDDQGTGLGLYIIENIVDSHGWGITATESAQGGARFAITGLETT